MRKLFVFVAVLTLFLSGCRARENMTDSGSRAYDDIATTIQTPLQVSAGIAPEVLPDEVSQITETSPVTEDVEMNVNISVNGYTFTATLYDNDTAKAFAELLPMEIDMNELNRNEKYYYLDSDLPTDPSVPNGISAGDIMLYGNSCLVLFYESFSTSYSYSPIGKLTDADGLKDALGNGGVTVKFELN